MTEIHIAQKTRAQLLDWKARRDANHAESEALRSEFRRLLEDARAEGMTTRDVGALIGLSHQRVSVMGRTGQTK